MARETGAAWIVCLGAERAGAGGTIQCPLRGAVDISRCLECHLLETVAAERRRDRECEAGAEASIQAAISAGF